MKKITVLLLSVALFVLVGCNGDSNRTDYYTSYYTDYYTNRYMDDFERLIADIDHLRVDNIDDIAEMVMIAWDHGAFVEVDYYDYYDGEVVDMVEINNEHQLEAFLDEVYYNEIVIYDVELFEEGYDLVLVFIADIQ